MTHAASTARRLLLGAAMAVIGASHGATAPDKPESLTFDHHDWTLACDNTRTCRAAGYQSEDGAMDEMPLPVSLLLTRAAGAGTRVESELAVDPGENGNAPRSVRLRIDGRDLGRVPLARNEATGRLSAAQTAAVLAVLARSSRIGVESDDGRRWTLSDRGASAVLLKMDEFQGRLGTPGALVRKGTRSESGVRAALAAPVVRIPRLAAAKPGDAALATSAALRAAIEAAPVPEEQSCGDAWRAREMDRAFEVVRLDAHRLLVSRGCWMAAYNVGVGYWVVRDRPPFRPVLVTTSGSDYADGQISSSQKGRGIGDCWSTAQWSWNGDRFVQTREATTGLCRGFAGGAWSLPTLVSDVRRDGR